MWEKTLIESNVYSRSKTRWTIPVAAMMHVFVLLGLILFSYWHVQAMEAPQASLQYVTSIPVSMGPPPAYGQQQKPKSASTSKQPAPAQNVQPTIIPPLSQVNESSESPVETGADAGDLPIGDPNGVIGGVGNSKGFSDFAPPDSDLDEPQIMNIYMTQPILVRRVEPEYPKMALMAHMEGVVILQAVITRTGSVEEVKTMRADFPVLEKAAKDAVLQWQYKPATLRGQPVKVYFTVTVTFHLKR